MPPRPRIGVLLLRMALSLLLIAAGIIAFLFYHDSVPDFRQKAGMLTAADAVPVDSGIHVNKFWLSLHNDRGLVAECGILMPTITPQKLPAIILLGGKATGKHAIDYVLGIDSAIIVAVNYPYEPRPSYTFWEAAGDLPAARTALLDMVPSVMLTVEYLQHRPNVDTNRIVLVGYSFGAPFVPVIASLDRRIDAAVMVYGGGGLYSMIRHNVGRFEGSVFSELVAVAGSLLLRPLEPLTYAASVSPTPLIMINGTDDEQIPRRNTEELFTAAREPKNLVWLSSRHVHPDNTALTQRIVGTITRELRRYRILPAR